MKFKSHKREAVEAALLDGNEAWEFVTECGEDDVLIGSYDECFTDLVHHYDGQDYPCIPPGVLIKIEPEELGLDIAWNQIISDPDYKD